MRVAKTTSVVLCSPVVWEILHARWCKTIHLNSGKYIGGKLYPRCRKCWRHHVSDTHYAIFTILFVKPTRDMTFCLTTWQHPVLLVPWSQRAWRSLSFPLGNSLAKWNIWTGARAFSLHEPTNIHIPYQYDLNPWSSSDPKVVWMIIMIVAS